MTRIEEKITRKGTEAEGAKAEGVEESEEKNFDRINMIDRIIYE